MQSRSREEEFFVNLIVYSELDKFQSRFLSSSIEVHRASCWTDQYPKKIGIALPWLFKTGYQWRTKASEHFEAVHEYLYGCFEVYIPSWESIKNWDKVTPAFWKQFRWNIWGFFLIKAAWLSNYQSDIFKTGDYWIVNPAFLKVSDEVFSA
jgi:hypothetical protein